MGRYEIIVWKQKYTRGSRPEYKCQCDDLEIIKKAILPTIKAKYPENWIAVYDTTERTATRWLGASVIELPPNGFKKQYKKKGDLIPPVIMYRPGKGDRNFGRYRSKKKPKSRDSKGLGFNDLRKND